MMAPVGGSDCPSVRMGPFLSERLDVKFSEGLL
jgi:hypothetical protein